jgi:hypothetical protein
MSLHFGFDLDNTLINYDLSALEYSKQIGIPNQKTINSLRSYLLTKHGNNYWTKAQSWIYTAGLANAAISYGALEAIEKLIAANHKVSIISHKTKFGPLKYGSPPFQSAAIQWIENSKIIKYFPNLNNIYFAESVEEKIFMIRERKLSHYVDDLLKIFLMDDYPRHDLKSFLFKPAVESPEWLVRLDSFDSLFDHIQ